MTMARAWKEKTGGKVVGMFCTYVPEELIYAAGMLPVRILGSHETEHETAQHILSMYCFFCRDCLAQGLSGRYDYVDGIVISQSCMHMRQAFHSWRLHLPVEFNHYINMPHHVQSPRAADFLAGELNVFKKALEEWAGRPITDADIDRGVEICNENRRLMHEFYELRKNDPPPVSGVEAMQVVAAGQTTDKEDLNPLLAEAITALPGRSDPPAKPATRLMIVGSEATTSSSWTWSNQPEPTSWSTTIAPAAGTSGTASNRTATGSRPWPKGTWTGCPAPARIFRRPPGSITSPAWPIEYKVQGVLLLQQKFCDPP